LFAGAAGWLDGAFRLSRGFGDAYADQPPEHLREVRGPSLRRTRRAFTEEFPPTDRELLPFLVIGLRRPQQRVVTGFPETVHVGVGTDSNPWEPPHLLGCGVLHGAGDAAAKDRFLPGRVAGGLDEALLQRQAEVDELHQPARFLPADEDVGRL